MKFPNLLFAILIFIQFSCTVNESGRVSGTTMKKVYEEIRTPYKYGLVMVPPDDSKMLDSPGVFRQDSLWYMIYIVFDGRGYETWLASSKDLLSWERSCRIMPFPADPTLWDSNQRAGYPALQDTEWGGTYQLEKYGDRYWMSYLGGNRTGYEEGKLSIGMASSDKAPGSCQEWSCMRDPVLRSSDSDTRWWENTKLYKSTVIRDPEHISGHAFIMFYNAYGDSLKQGHGAERIGMAVSDDMVNWKRFLTDPVLNHYRGITGDPQITRIGKTWVMFYFGAFWPHGTSDKAFNRFACSYDLVHWTDWDGKNLIEPTEEFDARYAHKSCVIKWNGTVYHFYCAVNNKDQRGIAVATSTDLGKSRLNFFRASDQHE